MELLRTSRTVVTADPAAGTVTKVCVSRKAGLRALFLHELRVNKLLVDLPPPFPWARLLGHDRRRQTMVLEAVPGPAYGPKFPFELADDEVDALVGLALSTSAYRPRQRWLRPYAYRSLLHRAATTGMLPPSALAPLLRFDPGPFVFAHGDITPRNVLRGADGSPVLIDFEWAGRYPPWYELAFLWFVLLDRPGARERVAATVPPADRAAFLFSALLVQVRHLQMWQDFRPDFPYWGRHLAGRDALLEELLDRA
jgi:hypothetical protein